jgi:hypothetical protein
MPKCPKCGREAGEGANYCPSCGSELRVDLEAVKLKVEELRHDEKVGWIVVVLGFALLLFSGWLGVGFTATRYEWRGLTLYEVKYHPYADAATMLLIIAMFFILLGGITSAHYAHRRSKLMKLLTR